MRRSGSTDTLVYVHTDHEGTPRLATNASAVKVWSWEGRAFGDTNPNQDPDGDGTATTINFRYGNSYRDSESNLWNMGYRTYDPQRGRFVTSDPMGLRGGMNTYAYVSGNPLRWSDPQGLDATVTYYHGQNGNVFGHIGIGVNTPDTVGFNPAPGQSTTRVLMGRDVPGVVTPDAGHAPLQTVVVPTTPEQDRAMQSLLDQWIANPGNYNLYSRQCTSFVADVLRAGGTDCGNPTKPETLIHDLQNERCRGR